jgi:uncharacterized protein
MTLLIVGLDPGTTLGCAIIDDNGNLVNVFSGKEISLSDAITRVIRHGRPVIVATDKKNPPGMLAEASAKLGAKLFTPRLDLLVREKRRLVKDFESVKGTELSLNSHEEDALASALLALLAHSRTLGKARLYLEKNALHHLEEEFIKLVVTSEGLSFDAAAAALQAQSRPVQRAQGQAATKPLGAAPAQPKYSRLLMLKDERISVLERSVEELKTSLYAAKKLAKLLKKRVKANPRDKLLIQKEEALHVKDKQIRQLSSELEKAGLRLAEIKDFISNSKGKVLVKKLDNLGQEELGKKEFLRIGEGDVLLVKEAFVQSIKAVHELKQKVKVIICEKPPAKKDKDFIIISKEGLIDFEIENYALADKKKLEDKLKEANLLQRIIDSYRMERQ